MKSAVQSANTVVFVPSSFDFIRVQNHFRSLVGTTHAALSEWVNSVLLSRTVNRQLWPTSRYSSNQDISRARQAFFSGNKSFLLVSERFHFFRRFSLSRINTGLVLKSSRFTGTKSAGSGTSFSTAHQTTLNSSPSSSLSLS